jgi:signal transduction histidine kinase
MRLAAIVEVADRGEARVAAGYARFRAHTSRIPAWAIDGFWTLFTYGLAFALTWFGGGSPPERDVGAWAYIIGIALAIPLYGGCRHPLRSLVAISLISMLYTLVEKPADIESFQTLPLIVAFYRVGSYRDRWRSLGLAFVAVVPLLVLADHYNQGYVGSTSRYPWAGSLVLFACAMAVGVATGSRRQTIESLKERARLAELNREEEARRSVDEERLRIARELHDVVAHSIVTISVQASMASHVFDTQPEQARAAVGEIRKLSKDTLQELRATLGYLRTADQDPESRTPAPGMDQIDALVARMRAAGLRIHLVKQGAVRPLPVAVDLIAYRIAQEALTNVVKHVGAANVEVELGYESDRFEIRVTDDGRGTAPIAPVADGTQHGLLGMRERAAAVGGKFAAGPKEGGGFEVCAMLPIGAVG